MGSEMQVFEVFLQLIHLESERLSKQYHEQLETMVERHEQEVANVRAQHSEKLRRLKMQARAIHEHDITMSFRRSEEMNTAYATEFQHELLKIIAGFAASLSV